MESRGPPWWWRSRCWQLGFDQWEVDQTSPVECGCHPSHFLCPNKFRPKQSLESAIPPTVVLSHRRQEDGHWSCTLCIVNFVIVIVILILLVVSHSHQEDGHVQHCWDSKRDLLSWTKIKSNKMIFNDRSMIIVIALDKSGPDSAGMRKTKRARRLISTEGWM